MKFEKLTIELLAREINTGVLIMVEYPTWAL